MITSPIVGRPNNSVKKVITIKRIRRASYHLPVIGDIMSSNSTIRRIDIFAKKTNTYQCTTTEYEVLFICL